MQWMGSKYRLLPQFTRIIGGTKEYYELFIGAGSVFLNKNPAEIEVICDADRSIATLWKVLGSKDESQELYNKFLTLDVSKIIFDELKSQKRNGFPNMSDVDVAVAAYYLTVYSFDGNRRNMRFGNKPEEWEDMMADAHYRLKQNWTYIINRAQRAYILHGDALKVLEKIKNRENATILLDPPYVPELLGENKHLYDVRFEYEKHVEMLSIIQNAKAKIVLCGYRGGTLLYDRYLNKDTGWHCYVVDDRLTKACRTGTVKGFATEFVWMNFELPANAKHVMDITDWALTQEEVDLLYSERLKGCEY